jgi:hypothetical protein
MLISMCPLQDKAKPSAPPAQPQLQPEGNKYSAAQLDAPQPLRTSGGSSAAGMQMSGQGLSHSHQHELPVRLVPEGPVSGQQRNSLPLPGKQLYSPTSFGQPQHSQQYSQQRSASHHSQPQYQSLQQPQQHSQLTQQRQMYMQAAGGFNDILPAQQQMLYDDLLQDPTSLALHQSSHGHTDSLTRLGQQPGVMPAAQQAMRMQADALLGMQHSQQQWRLQQQVLQESQEQLIWQQQGRQQVGQQQQRQRQQAMLTGAHAQQQLMLQLRQLQQQEERQWQQAQDMRGGWAPEPLVFPGMAEAQQHIAAMLDPAAGMGGHSSMMQQQQQGADGSGGMDMSELDFGATNEELLLQLMELQQEQQQGAAGQAGLQMQELTPAGQGKPPSRQANGSPGLQVPQFQAMDCCDVCGQHSDTEHNQILECDG